MEKERNILKIIVVMVAMFFCMPKVWADSCSVDERVALRDQANNVSISYITGEESETALNSDGDEDTFSVPYLHIKIYNMNENFNIRVKSEYMKDAIYVTYKNMKPDGSITLVPADLNKVDNFTFTIEANTDNCKGTKLRTVKLTVPMYNTWSMYAACDDIQDYYLCQRFTTYEISNKVFDSEVAKYKAKLEEDEKAKDIDKKETSETNIVSRTLSSVSDHKTVYVVVIILVGVVITYILLKKKRSVL